MGQTLRAEPAQELQINKEISLPGLFLAQKSSATHAAPHPSPACWHKPGGWEDAGTEAAAGAGSQLQQKLVETFSDSEKEVNTTADTMALGLSWRR